MRDADQDLYIGEAHPSRQTFVDKRYEEIGGKNWQLLRWMFLREATPIHFGLKHERMASANCQLPVLSRDFGFSSQEFYILALFKNNVVRMRPVLRNSFSYLLKRRDGFVVRGHVVSPILVALFDLGSLFLLVSLLAIEEILLCMRISLKRCDRFSFQNRIGERNLADSISLPDAHLVFCGFQKALSGRWIN